MKFLILGLCLSGCVMTPEAQENFRRNVERVDFKSGVEADQYGTRGNVGARVYFRNPDEGYKK